MLFLNRNEKVTCEDSEPNLEEATLDVKRKDAQLGHFIQLFVPIPQRLLWLTPLYLSRFLK